MLRQVPEILYEDNHLLVVNKRAGDLVQGDRSGDVTLIDTLKAYIKEKYSKPGEVFLGLVHRLDRPVSGAVIFARTSKALTRLTGMVKERQIEKIYWAIVGNRPADSDGRLVHFLVKNEKQNKSYPSGEKTPGAKRAELSYTLLASSNSFHLLEVNLHTGRHHQIRAQLAAAGFPIRGDLKYGAPRSNPDGSISLHARKLKFTHPVNGQQLQILAPLPVAPEWHYFELH
ncbi:MAG TPA: RluA family pseudouridine synthase [Lentimicrobium sp.]|jgi:23S rRNA pseudouridine1911/1915/1917 synthase|nr:RluA family pseudouridine synthase [Lentimicrobium sp.]